MAWVKEGKKQMLKVINYPQDLKAAHDLIDLLVQTINEVNDNNFDGDVPSTGIHSIPSPHDAIFCTPAGLNGGTPNDSNTEDGGVGFRVGGGDGVPSPSYMK